MVEQLAAVDASRSPSVSAPPHSSASTGGTTATSTTSTASRFHVAIAIGGLGGPAAALVAKHMLQMRQILGLKGDMFFDRLEQSLGDPQGACDEGRQTTGTVPIVHAGPKHVKLPGCHYDKQHRRVYDIRFGW